MEKKQLSITEFFEIKHRIDDEVARLGWDKEYCKRYIKHHYNKRSRRVMTDEQLLHLLDTLRGVATPKLTRKLLSKRKRLGG